ncbi:MAG TPA: carboxypeptidase regulatory-like domain-containing protein [Gemmatimonadales bacterium]|nr:carboxypeptidase regulatory-like domain-containing protein [Gemmatimonadales bacterium]
MHRRSSASGRSGSSGRFHWPKPSAASAATTAIALVLACATHLPAQAVRGQLVDRGNGFPIGGAFVVLLDQGGVEVARVLTGPDGTFLLRAPGPGTYQLQSKRIGFRVSSSPPLTVAEGQTVGFRLQVEAVPARLPPVVVEGRPQCGTRGDEGTAVARLWEEAREALAGVRWTAGQATLHYTVERFERDFAVAGGRVLKEQRSARSGYGETPFKSVPGEELVSRGYVVAGPRDVMDYYAPDAEVLLGDGFVNTHCFNARDGGDEHPGLVGLVFQPAPGRSLPDVQGVLWIEKATLELRFLDFTYARLPWGLPEGALGGHVEFMRLPSGAWIVKDWWIRMAQMARVVYRESSRQAEPKVLGFREAGGEVVTITAASGAVVFSALDAILEGTVVDSSRGGLPLPEATVLLEGTQREVTADERGRFQIAARLDGEYAVAFRHARLDSLGFTPDAVPVRLARGERATVALAVPPEPVVTARLCAARLEAGERVIVGRVHLAGTTTPAPGLDVRATWQSVRGAAGGLAWSDREAVATTDSSGSYVLCRIPEEERVTVRVRSEAGASSHVLLDFSEAGVWIDEKLYRSLPGRIWKQDFQIIP